MSSCPLQGNFSLNVFSDSDPSVSVLSGVALSRWLRLPKNHLVTWEGGTTLKHSQRPWHRTDDASNAAARHVGIGRLAVGLAQNATCFNSCPPQCCGASLLQRSGWVSHMEDGSSCLFMRLAVAVSWCNRKGLKGGGVWLFPRSPVQLVPAGRRCHHRSACTRIFCKIS